MWQQLHPESSPDGTACLPVPEDALAWQRGCHLLWQTQVGRSRLCWKINCNSSCELPGTLALHRHGRGHFTGMHHVCGYLSTQTGAGNPKRDERDVKVGRGVAIKKMRFTGFLALSSAKKEKRKKANQKEMQVDLASACRNGGRLY